MKKLTVKDVAREAGVSTATISRVLNQSGYVSEHVREHVLQVIKRLNYHPNTIARSLKQEKSNSIGIVLPDMTNPYFMTIARHIQRRCREREYHLLFMDSEEDEQKELEALNVLAAQRVEAIILAGTGGNRDKIESIRHAGIHMILIDRKMDDLQADIVVEDNFSASREAVIRLLEAGHRQIGIVRGPASIITAQERYAGVVAAFESAGLTLDSKCVYTGDYTRSSGMAAVAYFMQLEPRPTAVFSANNEMTFGFYLGLAKQNMDPRSVEIVSFGDLEFSSLFDHRLSVVMQDPEQIGQAASELVLQRLERGAGEPQRLIFRPKIVRK